MNTLRVDYDIYLKSIAWIGYDEKNYFISTSLQQFHSHNILISLYNLEVRIQRRNLQISGVVCFTVLRIINQKLKSKILQSRKHGK